MIDKDLKTNSILNIFEEMIMNMSEEEQYEARLEFNDIIEKHIKEKEKEA